MSWLGDEFMSNKESHWKTDDAVYRTIWGTLLFGCAIILLFFGEALFTGKNAFITFLGFFFMLIAAISYVRGYMLSMDVARKEGSRGIQVISRGLLAMGIVSLLIAVACIVSLIFA